jgi:phage shock protein A
MDETTTVDYGNAKLAVHNAQQTADGLDKKYRKRANRIKALRIELAQLESSMPALTQRMEQARATLKSAKAAYRLTHRDRKKHGHGNPGAAASPL